MNTNCVDLQLSCFNYWRLTQTCVFSPVSQFPLFAVQFLCCLLPCRCCDMAVEHGLSVSLFLTLFCYSVLMFIITCLYYKPQFPREQTNLVNVPCSFHLARITIPSFITWYKARERPKYFEHCGCCKTLVKVHLRPMSLWDTWCRVKVFEVLLRLFKWV
jgi:hypothetical protein